jgi:peroxiredoxin
MVGQGWDVGQIAPDFRLLDQHGDSVSLWQFYGKVIVVDISTMWCAPCQDLAVGTQDTYQRHIDDMMYITILHENLGGEAPTDDDVNRWADDFGITAPVLADGDTETGSAVLAGSYPALLVVNRDLTVNERVSNPEEALLEAAIEAALEED